MGRTSSTVGSVPWAGRGASGSGPPVSIAAMVAARHAAASTAVANVAE
jgi:hypothetical protein